MLQVSLGAESVVSGLTPLTRLLATQSDSQVTIMWTISSSTSRFLSDSTLFMAVDATSITDDCHLSSMKSSKRHSTIRMTTIHRNKADVSSIALKAVASTTSTANKTTVWTLGIKNGPSDSKPHPISSIFNADLPSHISSINMSDSRSSKSPFPAPAVVSFLSHFPRASPLPEYPFPSVLDPVKVPAGYYPIEVVQYWRGEYAPGRPLPLHWAIIVRTSEKRGNRHEIVGDSETYTTQDRFDVPLYETGDWRGGHVIGYVAPVRLDDLMTHVALVPVVRHRWTWNCQNWVFDALKALHCEDLYTDVNMTLGALQTQMSFLLEAWEVGDI